MAADTGKASLIGRAFAIIPLGLFGVQLYLLPRVTSGDVFRLRLQWIPSLDVSLALAVDGLSLLFALIISCIGFFVTLYAVDYLLTVFIFWELTTLFSYLLIGFECDVEEARQNARQALLVTGAACWKSKLNHREDSRHL